MTSIIERLKEPFPPDVVSWRVGSMNKEKTKGMALAYIDARDVMNRLDEVCGVTGWQCEYVPMPNGTACCRIGILSQDGNWVWKANGAENLTDSDKPDAKEMAIKGTYSDAFKRAAVLWGIGRYLYDLPSPWVAVNQYKQIEESERPKLRALLAKDAKPTPAPPRQDTAPKPAATSAKAIAAYVETFRFALGRADFESEVRGLWAEQADERTKLGITKESETYALLAGLCRDRIEEIGLAEQRSDAALVP